MGPGDKQVRSLDVGILPFYRAGAFSTLMQGVDICQIIALDFDSLMPSRPLRAFAARLGTILTLTGQD